MFKFRKRIFCNGKQVASEVLAFGPHSLPPATMATDVNAQRRWFGAVVADWNYESGQQFERSGVHQNPPIFSLYELVETPEA